MSWDYYPILRWKKGEQLAMVRLGAADRAGLLPIAEVQVLETGSQPKLEKTLRSAHADQYPIAIDIKPVYLGTRVPLARLAGRLLARFESQAACPHAAEGALNLKRRNPGSISTSWMATGW